MLIFHLLTIICDTEAARPTTRPTFCGSGFVFVGVAALLPTLTGHDDVAVLEANAGILSGPEGRITPVTGEPAELARQCETVPLGDTPCSANVPSGTRFVALGSRRPGEFGQSFDALLGDCHTAGSDASGRERCALTFSVGL